MTPKEQQELQRKSKGSYAKFMKSDGGKDFIIYYEGRKNDLLLKSMSAKTADEAHGYVRELAGLTTFRDYIIRQSKPDNVPSSGRTAGTRRPASKG